jgi:hypothetical protein
MPRLIEILKFVNLDAVEYDFVPNAAQRVTKFAGGLNARGSDTGKMGMHGFNPRRMLFEGMQITHEGKILAPGPSTMDEAGATLIGERDEMLACLLGDLSTPPAGVSHGVLTVQLAGWAHSASGAVQVSSWSADLTKDSVRTADYFLGWTLEKPYLLDDVDNTTQRVV